jgi:hypothetical protein
MYLYASPGAAFLKSNSKSALIYKQTAALSGDSINWYPEAVFLYAASGPQLALYDETTGTMVGAAKTTWAVTGGGGTSTTLNTMLYQGAAIADSNLTDGHLFGIRIAASAGTAYLYKSGIWAKITSNLQKARVLYRVGRSQATTTTVVGQPDSARNSIDLTAFKGLTNSSSAYLDTTAFCITTCPVSNGTTSLLDGGTSDSGISSTPVYGVTNGATAVSVTPSATTPQHLTSADTLKLATPASPGERIYPSIGTKTQLVTPFVAITTE